MSLLPSTKLSGREIRLTVSLLTVALFHLLLTAPGSAAYFIWTAFPELWRDMDDRDVLEAVADLLYCVNYSANFYLFCAADAEIRGAVRDCCKCGKCRKKQKQETDAD